MNYKNKKKELMMIKLILLNCYFLLSIFYLCKIIYDNNYNETE